MCEAYGIFWNMILPSSSWKQLRAKAVAYIVWGVSSSLGVTTAWRALLNVIALGTLRTNGIMGHCSV